MKIVTYLVRYFLTIGAMLMGVAIAAADHPVAECKGHVTIYLDSANCERTLTACHVLEGDDCADFEVVVSGTTSNVLDCRHAGKRVIVSVTPRAGGPSFYCSVLVEDRTAPALTCRDTFFRCDIDLNAMPHDSYGVELHEACKLDTIFPILCGVVPGNCIDDTLKTLKVLWQAWDKSGNTFSCTQMIKILRPGLDDVVPPSDDTLYCDNFDLSLAEQPTLFDSAAIDGKCGLILSYLEVDTIHLFCGEKWIVREWSVLDICTLASLEGTQTIAVLDTFPPQVICPENDTVELEANINDKFEYMLPSEDVIAGLCSEVGDIDVAYKIGAVIYQPEQVALLEAGLNTIVCTAVDQCWKTSTCTFEITVDRLPAGTEVALGRVGLASSQYEEKSEAYPNPMESMIDLRLSSQHEIGSDIKVTVLDANGIIFRSSEIQLAGDRFMRLDDLGDVPAGLLHVFIVSSVFSETIKLVKM